MKKIVLSFLLVLASFSMNSQSYVGFLTDNYSGVHGVISNPGSIVDSRYRADINLFGISAFAGNDLYGVNAFDSLNEEYDFETEAIETLRDTNNFVANLDILGPSFMFNINATNSVALFSRFRTFVNVNRIDGSTLELLDEDLDDINNIIVDEDDFNLAASSWVELGVSYARVLYNKEEHFLKGGLSLKYLQGAYSAYAYGSDLVLEVSENANDSSITDVTAEGQVTYANSIGAEDLDDVEDLDIFSGDGVSGSGYGVDLGFVYEWRPDYKNDTYALKNVNKYKLKLGVSITDIGNINYEGGLEESYELNLNSTDISDFEDLDDFSNSSYATLTSNEEYKISLPTALHINADYNINNNFYINLNSDVSLVSKTKGATSRITNMVSLTPRFERKWFSFYVPVSFVQYSGIQAGAGLRLGPLYVGSGSIITNLVSDNSKAADVYAGIKIPIYQGGKKIKDKDGDGVVDKEDACPKIAGPKENQGCPWEDTDKDGVMDNEDKCVDVVGPKENEGCPVLDTDKDGVHDKYDKCPEVAGAEDNNGCPWEDTDKDGVLDNVDKCPEVKGAEDNNGCPWGDKDKDGVLDNVDKCPEVVGVASREGCPEPKVISPIEEEKLKELQSFARAIYFNSGKSTFRPGVVGKLDLIAEIMNEYPTAIFNIEGHTDSQGAATTNRSLSDKRARAVLNYLISKGVASSRLSSIGYGEDYPIADNATRDGRAQNRRVEIKLRR